MALVSSRPPYIRYLNSNPLIGGLLLLTVLLSVLSALTTVVPVWAAGVSAWGAALLMLVRVRKLQRLQALVMVLLGGGGIGWGWLRSADSTVLLKAISANQALIAMLVAVTFLRLVAQSSLGREDASQVGKASIWQTLLGVHLFGAVINYSSVMILGERLTAMGQLRRLQQVVLSRGFSMAAMWSPFFAAMGVALTHAPGAHLLTLTLAGLPVACLALLLAGLELVHDRDADDFVGYPMRPDSLWVPSLLAVSILAGHALFPDMAVLTLVSLTALGLPCLVLLLTRRKHLGRELHEHVTGVLPNMGGETLLFLSAGVLATGISAVVANADLSLHIEHFGATEASVLLVLALLLSILGVHPVITVSSAGGALAPFVSAPDLLGMTFLMCWAVGVVGSPYSGIHLAMAGRFGLNNLKFLRWNASFTLKLLVLQILALHVYEYFGVW